MRQSRALRGTANEQDLRSVEISVERAQVDVARAREDLAAATISAPFSGVVSAVGAQVGSFVAANGALVTLLDDRELTLVAQMDESDVGRVEVGQRAHVTVGALGNRSFVGTVATVAPNARTEQNIPIFDVAITIENPSLEIRPGMTAEAVVTVREVEGTVSLPTAALQSLRGRHYLQVEQEDGTFAPHPVDVVATLGQSTVVQTDLPSGSAVRVPETPAAGSTAGRAGGQGPGAVGLPFGASGGGAGVIMRGP